MRNYALHLAVLALVGCGAGTVSTEPEGDSRQSIVGGTVSSSAQDFAVLLAMPDELCTGTLIAPNLVLTARHCVATPNESNDECVGYGATTDPGNITVFAGIDANPDIHTDAVPIATGAKITVPTTSNMCSFDVALVQLDREVAGAVAQIRFTPLAPNEPTIAIGYGVDGADATPSQRQQRTTTVLGVGPTKVPYTTKRGLSVTYDAPDGDVVTGESTCFGDSGGPLLDSSGRIVAVVSRGIPQLFPEDQAQFGNGCIDQPSVYAGVRSHEQLIREAARAAGHELPPSVETSPAAASAGDVAGDRKKSAAAGDDDDDDDTTAKKPAKKPRATSTTVAAPQAGAACSAAAGPRPAGAFSPMLAVVGLGLGLARRRSRSRSS